MSDRYWVALSSASWDSSNWSTTSGGPPGASVPDSTDYVHFDAGGKGNCLLDSTPRALGLIITSGYTGTLIQQSHVTIGSLGADLSGGHFIGNDSSFVINGNFTLAGTDFSCNKNLFVYGNFICGSNPERFHGNDGTVYISTTQHIFDPRGITFSNLAFIKDTTGEYSRIDSTSLVQSNLHLQGGYLKSGGEITGFRIYGNVYAEAGFGRYVKDHNVPIIFSGPYSQILFANGGLLPSVEVDKPTNNQVKVFGDYPIYINYDFLVHDGTFHTNTHDLIVGTSVSPPSPPSPSYDVDFDWEFVTIDFDWEVVAEPTITTTTLPPKLPRGWWKGEYNNDDSIDGNHATWWGNPEWDSNGYVNACFKTYCEDYGITRSYLVIPLDVYSFDEINFNIEAYVKYDQTAEGRHFLISVLTDNFINLSVGSLIYGYGIEFGAIIHKEWGSMGGNYGAVQQLYPSLTIGPDNNWHKYQLIDNKSGRTELYIDDVKQTPIEYYDHIFDYYSLCYFWNRNINSSDRIYCFFDEIKVW